MCYRLPTAGVCILKVQCTVNLQGNFLKRITKVNLHVCNNLIVASCHLN